MNQVQHNLFEQRLHILEEDTGFTYNIYFDSTLKNSLREFKSLLLQTKQKTKQKQNYTRKDKITTESQTVRPNRNKTRLRKSSDKVKTRRQKMQSYQYK